MKTLLILPHQLFRNLSLFKKVEQILLVEDPLYYVDRIYPITLHQQKIAFLKSSMRQYAEYLKNLKIRICYESFEDISNSNYKKIFKKHGVSQIFLIDLVDYIATLRITKAAKALKIPLEISDTPAFLTSEEVLKKHFKNKKHFHFTPFYIQQRKDLNLLIDSSEKPFGGKWSFDPENRKKIPTKLSLPLVSEIKHNEFDVEAISFVKKEYAQHPGDANDLWIPTNHKEAKIWLKKFVKERLSSFGDYEDAIVANEHVLFHSVLSPLLNTGLLIPEEVVTEVLRHHYSFPIELNNLEGFIRQVIGWREFIRAIYIHKGSFQRNSNFFKHKKKLPKAFYTASTGIEPIDKTICKVLQKGYCHHIERLMILGNFFLLCEIDPNDVYRWFMELFIDAYDWVMVPNVYGMSQYADGGLMVTKPYISGSNYLKKMGYQKGEWCEIWDALFWRFLDKYKVFFRKQPRWKILLGYLEKKGAAYIAEQKKIADKYLKTLK